MRGAANMGSDEMENQFTTAQIIERLEILWRKLEGEGMYVSANTVELAIGEIKRPKAAFKCAALVQGTAGGNDPADCDWPHCGCDQ